MTIPGIVEGVAGNAAWSALVSGFRVLTGRQIKISRPRPQEVLTNPEPLGSGFSYLVEGTLKRLPKGHEIWLLVQDQQNGSVRPQGFLPLEFNPQTKEWSGRINGYGTSTLKIVAVVAPPTSQDLFRYFQHIGSEIKDFKPLPRIPPECTNTASVQARLP